MNIQELKSIKSYNFECNMSDEYKGYETYDEWGSAFVWLGDEIGAEYNFCIDGGTNSCAIYKTEINHDVDCMETDYDTFVRYEINFNDSDWEKKLEDAMCEALIKFFEL